MRKLSLILLTIIGVAFFTSCEEDEKDPVIKMESNIAINELGEEEFEPVLADSISDSTFATFSWEKPVYNVSIVKRYIVEVDTVGNNFENSALVASVSDTNKASVTVFNFNKVLTKDLGMPADTGVTIEVRVGSVAGENQTKRVDYSEAMTMSLETYEPPFEPDELYVHGADGSLGTLLPVEGEDVPEGSYEGYVYVAAGGDEIQFGDEAGDVMLGSDDPTEPDDNGDLDGTLAENAGAIPVDSAYYWVQVNTYDNGYDLYETAWGVIGSGIDGWSEDIDMTYQPDEDVWTIEVEAQDGEFKFRPNDQWPPDAALDYGDNEPDNVPDFMGDNIPISAGMKKITLDLSEYPYSYSVEDAK